MSINLGITLAALTLAVVSYPHIRDYFKRPKLELEPLVLKPDSDTRLLGFRVKNRGRNTAKNVSGVEERGGSSVSHTKRLLGFYVKKRDRNVGSTGPVMWYNERIMQGGLGVENVIHRIDIEPERRNDFYHFYIAIMKKSEAAEFPLWDKVITIILNWEYKGDRKTELFEFPFDVFSKRI